MSTIVISGRIGIKPEKREEAIQAGQTMMAATHQEEGCIDYEFFFPLTDPGTVFVFEEWESQAHLEKHFVAAHMGVFREQLKDIVTGESRFKRYVVESAEKM